MGPSREIVPLRALVCVGGAMIVVYADHEAGVLNRYETGGECVRRTHSYCHGAPVAAFGWEVMQEMRLNPPDYCAVEPPPRPTNPPASAGTVRIAA